MVEDTRKRDGCEYLKQVPSSDGSRYLKRVTSKRDGCEYLKQVPSYDGSGIGQPNYEKVNEDLFLDKPLHVIHNLSKLAYRM
jgi:hypothetical protein